MRTGFRVEIEHEDSESMFDVIAALQRDPVLQLPRSEVDVSPYRVVARYAKIVGVWTQSEDQPRRGG